MIRMDLGTNGSARIAYTVAVASALTMTTLVAGASPPAGGLQVWLKAGALALTDGAPVTFWPDQSGNTFDVSQALGGSQPTYVASGFGGQPSVRFDGIDDFLTHTASDPLANCSVRTVFVVSDGTDTGNGGAAITFRRTTRVMMLGEGYSGGLIYVYTDGINSNNNATIPTSYLSTIRSPHITTYRSRGPGSTLEVSIDGDDAAAEHFGGAIAKEDGAVGFTIGNREDHPSGAYAGDISEILVYEGALTPAEQCDVLTYLSAEYGIAVNCPPPEPPPAVSTAPLSFQTGLRVWLRSDVGVTTDNCDRVTLWEDQSGNGFDVIQTTDTNMPRLDPLNGIAGLPSLLYDGDDVMRNSSVDPVASGAARTVFAVANSQAGSGGTLVCFRRTTLVHTLQLSGTSTIYVYSDGVNGANNCVIDPGFLGDIQVPHMSMFRVVGGGSPLEVQINTVDANATHFGGSVVAETGTTGFTIGYRDDHAAGGWKGQISEVLIYDTALSDEEKCEVESYLSEKYGLPVTPPASCDPWTDDIIAALCSSLSSTLPSTIQGFLDLVDATVAGNPPPSCHCLITLQDVLDSY